MDNPASIDDLADRWYPNPLADSGAAANATMRLDEAWRALQSELPGVVARLTDGSLSTDSVIDVLCSAALRMLRNPEGYAQGSSSIDDFSETWQTDPSLRTNDLYFTAAELRRLTPSIRGAFTITPGCRR